MQRLSRELVEQNASHKLFAGLTDLFAYPEKILQFGEGNFMRGFTDWMIHRLNVNGKFGGRIVSVQPTPHGKVVPKLNAQDGLYTVLLRGVENGEVVDRKEVVASISRGLNPYTQWAEVLQAAANPDIRIVFSNTTEAGLAYAKEPYDPQVAPLSFPGKLTACLYHRYQALGGAETAGWLIVPCELVENNGATLQKIVLQLADDWQLPTAFKEWVLQHNRFYTTLVDRIVTGYPHDHAEQLQEELGYEDLLLTVGEPYHLFAIEGDDQLQALLPFPELGLNVHFAPVQPFRELKVKILNGSHTLMCPVGFLSGKQTVLDVMNDAELSAFVREAMQEEILPVVAMDEESKQAFASAVLDRFANPFNKHYLLDISLNSVHKFKERLLPSLLAYQAQNGQVPPNIAQSLAAWIAFYRGTAWNEDGKLIGQSVQGEYLIRDSQDVLQFFYDTWQSGAAVETIARQVLGRQELWGCDLTQIPGLTSAVQANLVRFLATAER